LAAWGWRERGRGKERAKWREGRGKGRVGERKKGRETVREAWVSSLSCTGKIEILLSLKKGGWLRMPFQNTTFQDILCPLLYKYCTYMPGMCACSCWFTKRLLYFRVVTGLKSTQLYSCCANVHNCLFPVLLCFL
jgi:hypothetical protein